MIKKYGGKVTGPHLRRDEQDLLLGTDEGRHARWRTARRRQIRRDDAQLRDSRRGRLPRHTAQLVATQPAAAAAPPPAPSAAVL